MNSTGAHFARYDLSQARFVFLMLLSTDTEEQWTPAKLADALGSFTPTKRDPTLIGGVPHTGLYCSGEQIVARSLILTLSRADLAEFMLKQLTGNTLVHRAPRVMY